MEVQDEGKRRAIKESLVVLAIVVMMVCVREREIVLAVAWLRATGGEEERNWKR